jgi:hypothetical protein
VPSCTASYFLLNLVQYGDIIKLTVAQGWQRVSYAAAELIGSDSSKFTGKSHSENVDLRKDFSLSSKDYLSQCTPAIKTTIARASHILQQDKPARLL